MRKVLNSLVSEESFGEVIRSFGGESGLQKLGLCGIHPLTQRYA
ncbi:DUF3265 domain-containing protein [Vibrio vulnificus]|nr:DUF3265 domain-containing protein [Vibrio vulnificus]